MKFSPVTFPSLLRSVMDRGNGGVVFIRERELSWKCFSSSHGQIGVEKGQKGGGGGVESE